MISRRVDDWFRRQKDVLDPLAETLHKSVHGAYRAAGKPGRKAEDALHGTWLGHPLHPLLVTVPIGAGFVASLLDALEVATDDEGYGKAADVVMALAVASGYAAIAAGWTDWHRTSGMIRRVGLVHGLMNETATTMLTASVIARRTGRRELGRALGWSALGIVAGGAYLGGHMVYRHKMGTDHTKGLEVPQEFTRVVALDDLPDGQLHGADVKGTPVVLLRRGQNVQAIVGRCSHLGGPLAEGELLSDERHGDCVKCPWHDSVFRLSDGSVVHGPAVYPEPAFEVRVREGQVEVRAVQA